MVKNHLLSYFFLKNDSMVVFKSCVLSNMSAAVLPALYKKIARTEDHGNAYRLSSARNLC